MTGTTHSRATHTTAKPEPSGPHPYFMAIEEVFLELRGAPLQLSPADYQLAKKWRAEGIPLELVERTVREVFARRKAREDEKKDKKVWGLSYCKRAVQGAWRRQQELTAPASTEAAEEFDLAGRLERLAESLPDALASREAFADRIRGAQGGAEAIEEQLAALDGELVEAVRAAMSSAERAQIDAELAASLQALAARLPADELERAAARLREEIERRHLALPVLSLFAPEAMDPAEG